MQSFARGYGTPWIGSKLVSFDPGPVSNARSPARKTTAWSNPTACVSPREASASWRPFRPVCAAARRRHAMEFETQAGGSLLSSFQWADRYSRGRSILQIDASIFRPLA